MSDATVTRLPAMGMITLRGALPDLAPAVRDLTGCDMPEARMMARAGEAAALWMSPDELLILCPYRDAPSMADRLRTALNDAFATVAVVSDARAVFEIGGPGAEDVLASLAPVDFSAMAGAEVRRTRLAQVPAAFWREGEGFRLVCFRSVARYVEDVLANAAGLRPAVQEG
jgi:sarcosine oxidase subunit gamma